MKSLDIFAATALRYYAQVAEGIWCANWELGYAALGIQCHFAKLALGERGVQDKEAVVQLPRYAVSWVLNENL